jgi:hypothetical protein
MQPTHMPPERPSSPLEWLNLGTIIWVSVCSGGFFWAGIASLLHNDVSGLIGVATAIFLGAGMLKLRHTYWVLQQTIEAYRHATEAIDVLFEEVKRERERPYP